MSVFFTRRGKAAERGPTFVEYIESNGEPWIDTGVVGKSGVKIRLKCIAGANSVNGHIMAATKAWNPSFALSVSTQRYIQYGYGKTFYTSNVVWTAGKMYDITFETSVGSQRLTINGETVLTGTDSTLYDVGFSLFLPGCNNGGTQASAAQILPMKICFLQAYENDVLVRDCWPCYDPDGVACVYDKVDGKYYYNQGSGSFTAGGLVPQKCTIEFDSITGSTTLDSVTINGTKYQFESSLVGTKLTVERGSVIHFYGTIGSVYVNGVLVDHQFDGWWGSYDYVVTGNITISDDGGVINITEL